MKPSRLRKKSPVFRQGYRTGHQEGVTMNNNDDAAAVGRRMAAAGENKMTEREEQIADTNYDLGERIGYERGYEDGCENAEREKTDLTLAGLIIVAVIAAAVGFGIGLFVGV